MTIRLRSSPTIKELCNGRLAELPRVGEASRAERIAVMQGNLQVMREEIGRIPFFYPQSEGEVAEWLDSSDRTIGRLTKAMRGLAKLPADTLVPSPFNSCVRGAL